MTNYIEPGQKVQIGRKIFYFGQSSVRELYSLLRKEKEEKLPLETTISLETVRERVEKVSFSEVLRALRQTDQFKV